MSDSLDRASKEAVSALACAIVEGISDAACSTVRDALEATISDATESIDRLEEQMGSIGHGLEPFVRDSIRTEVQWVRSEMASMLDLNAQELGGRSDRSFAALDTSTKRVSAELKTAAEGLRQPLQGLAVSLGELCEAQGRAESLRVQQQLEVLDAIAVTERRVSADLKSAVDGLRPLLEGLAVSLKELREAEARAESLRVRQQSEVLDAICTRAKAVSAEMRTELQGVGHTIEAVKSRLDTIQEAQDRMAGVGAQRYRSVLDVLDENARRASVEGETQLLEVRQSFEKGLAGLQHSFEQETELRRRFETRTNLLLFFALAFLFSATVFAAIAAFLR